MRTTALLSLLSLWTEMTAVRAGRLIAVAATACGSEQVSTAGSSCEPKEKEASAHPGDSTINGDFLPIFGFNSFLECSHFHSTSGIEASYGAVSPFPLLAAPDSIKLFDEHFIRRCAAVTCRNALPLCTSILSVAGSVLHNIRACVWQHAASAPAGDVVGSLQKNVQLPQPHRQSQSQRRGLSPRG